LGIVSVARTMQNQLPPFPKNCEFTVNFLTHHEYVENIGAATSHQMKKRNGIIIFRKRPDHGIFSFEMPR
jgi:hypothetical protein